MNQKPKTSFLRKQFKYAIPIFKETGQKWLAKDPFKLSAVIAYYSVLSLPALLILVLNLVGGIWGRERVLNRISNELRNTLGADTAQYLREMMVDRGDESTSVFATIIGIIALLYGSTSIFYQLQNVMDEIWNTEPKYKNGIIPIVLGRLKSFGFILVFGFLLLISLVLTSLLSAFSEQINSFLPEGYLSLVYVTDIVISLFFIYFLFAAMFKYLPSTPVRWRAVRSGAALTALLFVIGKYLLAIYFKEAEPGSTYGAAGSIILVMLWISYTSLIVFFGAQYTKVVSDKFNLS
jgi:membrane protein